MNCVAFGAKLSGKRTQRLCVSPAQQEIETVLAQLASYGTSDPTGCAGDNC